MSFDPVAYINTPRWQESRLGLHRIQSLMERLGSPQNSLRFVHVAGTNGKGSTCAYLASVLQAAGYRTGLFTSPYIETFEERIRVDGANIPLDELAEVTLAVKAHADALEAETGEHPTEFELMTAVALVHFARRRCDIVVLEVGMGGRLDSTNVVAAPEVCVVTRIGLDHTAVLGSTVAAVAGEKAGIIKSGAAVISWPQEHEAMRVVEDAAQRAACALRVPDFSQLEVCPARLSSGTGTPLVREFSYRGVRYATQLLGSYQPYNAALAIEAVEALRQRGWCITDAALRGGIAATVWPGRFEVVANRPLFIVDGGHNPQGAQVLAESLRDVLPHAKPVFVVSVLSDKDYPAMLAEVLPLASAVVAVAPPNPRALAAQDLARAITRIDPDVPVHVAEGFPDAVALARGIAGEEGVVVAFGSLYSVGDIKRALR